MKASFIIGFIAVSAAVLTFAAFAPMQQATQVRRLLAATTSNATASTCNVTGTAYAVSNATAALLSFVNYTCNMIETDNDGTGSATAITLKYYFTNSSASFNYTVNTTATVVGVNTTVYLTYVNQTVNVTTTPATSTAFTLQLNPLIQIVNQTIVSYNGSNVTVIAAINTTIQNQIFVSSQNQTFIAYNFTTTYNASNSSVANSTLNYTQIINQQTNSTNVSILMVSYNQSGTNATLLIPTSVLTYTLQVVNYTSNNLTFMGNQSTNVSTQVNYQLNQTLTQNQSLTFPFLVINVTNMSLSTNATNMSNTQIVCITNSSNSSAQLVAAITFNTSGMNSNPFPLIVAGEMSVNLSVNAAPVNFQNPAYCNITGVFTVSSISQPFNSANTPQGVKQAAKTVLYCSLFQTRQTYAQGNLTLLACPSTNQNFKCKKAANLLIIQKSWVKHWCTNQAGCAGGANSMFNQGVAALLQARVTACAKGPNRSQKVCNGAYVRYNAVLKNQRDVCAPF